MKLTEEVNCSLFYSKIILHKIKKSKDELNFPKQISFLSIKSFLFVIFGILREILNIKHRYPIITKLLKNIEKTLKSTIETFLLLRYSTER